MGDVLPDSDEPTGPLVRVEHASLGTRGHVAVVLSGISDPARLRGPWSSAGAAVEQDSDRLHAVTIMDALARAAGRSLPRTEAELLDRRLRAAVTAWSAPPPDVPLPDGRVIACTRRPVVMGIVNVTPDSFSDDGLYPAGHPDAAIAHGRALVEAGADLLDIGGESSRPGAAPVEEAEELTRVVPVVEALAGDGSVCSVDTTKPAVARAALGAGAVVVNDVSGARDPALLDVVAEAGAAYVLMHSRGVPADMPEHADYADVVAEVYEFLAAALERLSAAGIADEKVIIDPGLGFAKTATHNLALVAALRQFRGLGRPVLLGASRKSFLGQILDSDASGRLEGSLACAVAGALAGAAMIRVHDVAETVRALRTAHAIDRRAVDWPAVVDRASPSSE